MTALRILIIDDDRDFADGLLEVFELYGHAPSAAHGAGAGIRLAGQGDWDAVLIDIGLPDTNGVDCLAAIRAERPDLRCFLLTGYSADHIVGQGMQVGDAEILTKPVDPDMLVRRLAEIAS